MKSALAVAVLGAAVSAQPSTVLFSNAPWAKLNETVQGRLHKGIPYPVSCYDNYNGAPSARNDTQCAIVKDNRRNEFFLDSQFGGVMNSNWATCQATGSSCVVPGDQPADKCNQGTIPPYYIDVRKVEDVQAGLAFAQKYKLPVVVKNTGHDYKGRSMAPNSLSLWTHNILPDPVYHETFTPDGCAAPESKVVTMGAGQQLDGLYKFTNSINRDIVGGADPAVGIAGGFITGGGHSALSPSHGLAVDNAIQIRAVLPNGTYITANRCQNTDLFFAMRGGGGGTFGVIFELTYRTLDRTPLQVATYPRLIVNATTQAAFLSMMVENGERWADEGWGGFWNVTASPRSLTVDLLGNPNLNASAAIASLKPIDDFYAAHASSGTHFPVQNFYQFYALLSPNAKSAQFIGGGASLSSRLTPRSNYATPAKKSELAKVLFGQIEDAVARPDAQNYTWLSSMVTPSSYTLPHSDRPGGPGYASLTPAWRTSIWHWILTAEWENTDTSPAFVQHKFQATHDIMQELRRITPAGGAYINEADTFEPGYEESFWGENSARLAGIKKSVDPGNVLSVHQGVGWVAGDGRFACYPDVQAS